MKLVIAFIGRLAYIIGGPIAFPLFMSGSKRSRLWIMYEGKVLLVQSVISLQRWNMPGGGIEKGEAAVAAAVREVSEELGIEISTDTCTQLFEEDYKGYFSTCHQTYFMARLAKKPTITTHPLEILDYRWFSLDELHDAGINLHPNVKTVMKHKSYTQTQIAHKAAG